jgi:glycerol-3-phosphate dehydrogenase (NAD(P)+)
MRQARVSVLNAGGWGTALACVLAGRGHAVHLWARRDNAARVLAEQRENEAYLPGIRLPPQIAVTADLAKALIGADLAVIAPPTVGLRPLAHSLAALRLDLPLLVVVTKGLELETWLRPSEVLLAELGQHVQGRLSVLSGPTHAEEVARGLPTAAVVAAPDRETARRVRDIVATPSFRLYAGADVAGVELCAAAKNCVAIAAGIADGLGYGDNARAALVTRSLVELGRLVAAHGGTAGTVAGLAGIGDLIATCGSRHSRNRRAGELFAQGLSAEAVQRTTPMVVEGIPAARGIVALARAAGVEMPICEAVCQVIYARQDPRQSISELLARSFKDE